MKKQLLIGSALLAAISAYPQSGSVKAKPSSIASMTKLISTRFAAEPAVPNTTVRPAPVSLFAEPENAKSLETAVLPPSTINWNLLCGSMNIFGMIVSNSRPLQYNDNVNAVSFIHRKSANYQPSPAIPANAQSGVIVAEISSNWGATWDSTCIWSNATNWGRYPQGGIYNPVGNTNIANAYVVGMGPLTVAATGWVGDFYASKQLNAFNNTASTVTGAQQFLASNLSSYPSTQGPHAFSRYGFSSTDDGVVRSLAFITDDPSALTGMRGVSIVKGTFNSGTFTWSTDSIIPSTIVKTDGTKVLNSVTGPQMVWNEAGTVGYVVVCGAAAGATNSNKGGFQPIIYKTTNSGLSWTLLPGIDFNSTTMAPILDHIAALNTNTNVAVPFFADMDMVVDANNQLHIGATIMTGASDNIDSLSYYAQYTISINPGEEYKWAHLPGQQPYLYDFIGDGTAPWIYKTIDSLSSEGPSAQTGQAGFNDNPWAGTVSSEPVKGDNLDSRIQLGRTPDGQYITFSFAESDTNFTNGGRKWNSLPNVKTRCMAIGTGTSSYQLSPTEINVTKVATGTGTNNPNIASRATLHYMSPTTGSAVSTPTPGGFVVDIMTPMTVTNSNPLDPSANNSTWYQSGKLSYLFGTTGIHENSQNSASNAVIYPNPASNNAVLAIDLKNNSNVDITVLNTVGQVVKNTNAKGQLGNNNIDVDLNGLSSGIYMVTIKIGNASSTKKLIVK